MEQEKGPTAEASQPAPMPAGYEFTPQQDLTIKNVAQRMKIIGVFYLVFGGLAALGGIFILVQSLPQALIAFLEVALFAFIGLWHYRAAASFQMIVQTRWNDIMHLMKALEELRKIYNLQVWLMIIVIGLLVLGVIVGVLIAL